MWCYGLTRRMKDYSIRWLLLVTVLFATFNAAANIVLPGYAFIGDDNNNAVYPMFIARNGTNNWRPEKPLHFHLTHDITFTRLQVNSLSSANGALYFVIWNDSDSIVYNRQANSGFGAVNATHTLTAGHYKIAVLGQCQNRNNPIGWRNNCNGRRQDYDDFSYYGIEFVTSDSTDSFAFVERRHIGDGFDDEDSGYGGRYYPDYSQGASVSYFFNTVNNTQLERLYLNGVRDVIENENYNSIRIRSSSDSSMDYSFFINVDDDEGDFSWDLTGANLIFDSTKSYEVRITTGDTGGGDLDDISFDDLVLQMAPAVILTCPDTSPLTTIYENDFSSQVTDWQVENFNRNISNWPGESIYNSFSETQNVVYNLSGGRLNLNGSVSPSGDNEYGAIVYDVVSSDYDSTQINNYSITADLYSNATSTTNNDAGIVFGYVDDENYYLLRWTKFGATYSNDATFPGTHRSLDLIKVSGGTASLLASSANFYANDPISFQITVNGDGITICANNTALINVANEQPSLMKAGFYSYDNDIGTSWDNLVIKCDGCSKVQPAVHYTFDQCEYNNGVGQVIDFLGNVNGTPFDDMTTQADGVLGRSAELVDYGDHVETSVLLGNTWTSSVWIKTPFNTAGNSPYHVLAAFQGGGDFMFLDSGNNFRWGVYEPVSGSSINGNFQFGSLSDGWHNVVLVGQNGTTSLYVDGTYREQINLQATGTLQYIGTSFDSVGTNNAQGFRAPLDEFVVFDFALNAATISNYYNNQLAGLNYDGTSRTYPGCSDMIAYYRFEQVDFSSGITDSSGNNNDGFGINASTLQNGKYCKGMGINGTNNISTDSALNTQLDLDADVGSKGTISFWYSGYSRWSQGGVNGNGEKTLFDASSASSQKYFHLEIQNSGQLRFAFEDSDDKDLSITESLPPSRDSNTWYYVTVTWDYSTDDYQIFVDGVLVAENTNQTTNGQPGNMGALIFGDNSSTYASNNHNSLPSYASANGIFDEIRIYNRVLSPAEITTDMNDSQGCSNIDHYRLVYDSSALTCEAEPVTVQACVDSNCSTLYTGSSTLTLSPSGWVGGDNISFIGSSQYNLSHTTAETVTLGINSPNPSASLRCFKDGVEDPACQMTFSSVGLQFLYGASESLTAADQIAGTPFNIKVQAVKDSNGVCSALFQNDLNIDFALECNNPSTCSSESHTTFQLAGTSIAKNNGSTSSYSSIPVNFGANSKSDTLQAVYNDAGQVTLRARYNGGGLDIAGAANFRVKPAAFNIAMKKSSAGSAINGNSSNSSTTHVAGENAWFELSAISSTGLVTPNYVPGDIEFDLGLDLPASGSGGQFKYGTSLSMAPGSGFTTSGLSTSRGEYSFNAAHFTEVGVFSLDVRDHSYLSNMTIDSAAITIGRFIPDYLKATSMATPVINDSCSGFTYMEQPFDLSVNPMIQIEAYNALGNLVNNYGGAFWKLSPLTSDISYVDSSGSAVLNVLAEGSLTVSQETDYDGDGEVTVEDAQWQYLRTATPVAPFISSMDMTFNTDFFTDSDNVCLKDTGTGEQASCQSLSINNIGATEQRYGRIFIDNAYGPETEALRLPFVTEYYNGTTFIQNTLDSCSAVTSGLMTTSPAATGTSPTSFTGISVGGSTTDATFNAAVSAGDFNFILTSPGDGNTGEVTIGFDSTGLDAMPWLKYYWNGTSLSVPPSGVATFGSYRGNDRAIYWREKN